MILLSPAAEMMNAKKYTSLPQNRKRLSQSKFI